MNKIDLGALLEESGAILRGHFLLSSGRHSEVYFEKFRVLEQPRVLSALCGEIADRFREVKIDVVAGPTTGGIIIAFEVARQLGVSAIYVETEAGKKTLRRNAQIEPGASVLIVDDVLTTGLSLSETATAIREHGGEVAGYGVLIDRSAGGLNLEAPLFSAYEVQNTGYSPDAVPEWLQAIPITKPGTRVSPGK